MKIIEILAERPTLSFEFFPPKTDAGIDSLFRAIGRLKTHAPDYVSVTYGAGGSTKALTEELAVRIKDEEGPAGDGPRHLLGAVPGMRSTRC